MVMMNSRSKMRIRMEKRNTGLKRKFICFTEWFSECDEELYDNQTVYVIQNTD